MPENAIEVVCECGFTSQGQPDDVVKETQKHGQEVHNMDVSRDQVMAMSRPSTPPK